MEKKETVACSETALNDAHAQRQCYYLNDKLYSSYIMPCHTLAETVLQNQ